MQKMNLNELIEYNDTKALPKVLINEPGYRMVLLNLRAQQSIPEHANQAVVTVYAIRGHITFYERSEPCELRAGEVVRIAAGSLHHIEAHEDSSLFVLATGTGPAAAKKDVSQDNSEELDLREVPRPLRHPLIFQKFDALAVGGSLRLLNDHDPVPLSRQFDELRRGQAAWEYIERGPRLFRIRIRRLAPSQGSDVPVKPPVEGLLTGIK